MDLLPDELLEYIFQLLGPKLVLTYQRVCKKWYKIGKLFLGKEYPLLFLDNQIYEGKTKFIGHSSSVICVASQGELAASGSFDYTVRVWNLNSGTCLLILEGHLFTVYCVHLKEPWVISGSGDNSIKVWNLENGECLKTLVGHTDSVLCLKTSGTELISGSADGTIKFWDLETGEVIHSINGHNGSVVSCLEIDEAIPYLFITAGADTFIKIWEKTSLTCMKTLQGHQTCVGCIKISKGGILVSGSQDGIIKVWDIHSGACVKTLLGHTSGIRCVQIMKNSVISCANDMNFKLWDIHTGTCLKTWKGVYPYFIRNFQLLESNTLLNSIDCNLAIWETIGNPAFPERRERYSETEQDLIQALYSLHRPTFQGW